MKPSYWIHRYNGSIPLLTFKPYYFCPYGEIKVSILQVLTFKQCNLMRPRKHSFFVAVPAVWNATLPQMHTCPILITFKKSFKNWWFSLWSPFKSLVFYWYWVSVRSAITLLQPYFALMAACHKVWGKGKANAGRGHDRKQKCQPDTSWTAQGHWHQRGIKLQNCY